MEFEFQKPEQPWSSFREEDGDKTDFLSFKNPHPRISEVKVRMRIRTWNSNSKNRNRPRIVIGQKDTDKTHPFSVSDLWR